MIGLSRLAEFRYVVYVGIFLLTGEVKDYDKIQQDLLILSPPFKTLIKNFKANKCRCLKCV